MPGANVELTDTVTATALGASITFQAPNVGPRGLQIVSIALLVTGSTVIPNCTAYRNVIADQNVMARKTAGDRGTFIGQDDILYMGQQLVIVWGTMTAGARCTATLRGYGVATR